MTHRAAPIISACLGTVFGLACGFTPAEPFIVPPVVEQPVPVVLVLELGAGGECWDVVAP